MTLHDLQHFAAFIDEFIDGTGVAPLRTSRVSILFTSSFMYRRHAGDSH